jgi:hypothetical protein
MSSHERNLQTIEFNLAMFQRYSQANPTAWNMGKVVDLTLALADYRRFMAGEIQCHEMCLTAKELTMDMPSWGTYGT